MRKFVVVLAAVFLLAGCGGKAATDKKADETTPPPKPPTATELATKIKAAVPSVVKITTITEDNDPNDKIGRPNGYTDGAVLTDKAGDTSDTLGVAYGATIEVWPTKAEAQDRMDFIQKSLKDMPMLGTEYDYVHDGYLLRISGELKPSIAKQYEAAFNASF